MVKEIQFDSEIRGDRALEFDLTKEDAKEIVADLIDTIKTTDLVYLCANEIGYNKRAVVVKFGDDYKSFVNPLIQDSSKPQFIRELDRCTGKEYIMPRYTEISIMYQDEEGEVKANKLEKDAAIVFNQIMDCLDGLKPDEYGLEVLPEFDKATDEEREELLKEYAKELGDLQEALDQELMSDEQTKARWRDLKYEQAKENGEIELEYDEIPLNRAQRRMRAKLMKKAARLEAKKAKVKK